MARGFFKVNLENVKKIKDEIEGVSLHVNDVQLYSEREITKLQQDVWELNVQIKKLRKELRHGR